MKKIALFLTLIALMGSTSTQAYEAEPTKKDMKEFYALLKIIYSDMPALMNGFEVLIDNDFDLNKIKDKKNVCDAVQAAERITYIANQSKVHPYFQKSIDQLRETMPEDNAKVIKQGLQDSGYKCL